MNNAIQNEVIEIKDLEFGYGKNNIIKGLNLNIANNEFVAILGPNGAGKTTLFNIISGILPFKKGSVNVLSKDIKRMSFKEKASTIGVVPQETASNFNFSNIDIVLMGRACKKSRFVNENDEDYQIAIDAMKMTKTDHLAERTFMETSGGEKQRIIISQVLAQETQILLLDEPTSSLDINFQIEIMQLIEKVRKEKNLTVLGIFHDINIATQYAERIILLKDGKVYADGLPEEVIIPKNIYNVFNAQVVIERNPYTNKLFMTPHHNSHYEAKLNPENRKKIHIISGGGSGSYLFNVLTSEGHQLTTCILSSIDTDTKIAKKLSIPLIIEEPYIEFGEENKKLNLKYAKNSDCVVVSRVLFGKKNYLNLQAAFKALELNRKVFLIDSENISNRDYTGGIATALYEDLLGKGAINVKSEEELIMILN